MSARRQLHPFSGAGSTSLCRWAILICIALLIWKTLKLSRKKKDSVLMQKHKFWITSNKQTVLKTIPQEISRGGLTEHGLWCLKQQTDEAMNVTRGNSRQMPTPAPKLLPLIRSTQWWSEALHVTVSYIPEVPDIAALPSQKTQLLLLPYLDLFLLLLTASSNLNKSQSSAFHHCDAQFV